MIRDPPFNLQGGGYENSLSFRIFFSDNTRVRKFSFYLLHEARIFFLPEVNIRLYMYDKNSESDYFFSSTKITFFSASLGIRIFFLGKNHNPPPHFKLNGRSLQYVSDLWQVDGFLPFPPLIKLTTTT